MNILSPKNERKIQMKPNSANICLILLALAPTSSPTVSLAGCSIQITCPNNITTQSNGQDAQGVCGVDVYWTEPTVVSDCPPVMLTSAHSPYDFFPVGMTTVTYTATDAKGNTATCSFTVTVDPGPFEMYLDPEFITAGGPTFTLFVRGSNF